MPTIKTLLSSLIIGLLAALTCDARAQNAPPAAPTLNRLPGDAPQTVALKTTNYPIPNGAIFAAPDGPATAPGTRAAPTTPPLPELATGASVDERRVARTLYVAQTSNARDEANGGTREKPFASLNFALQSAAKLQSAGTGVKVVVGDGIYREAITLNGTKRTAASGALSPSVPLVVEAQNVGKAIISGSDTRGFEPSTWTKEGDFYTHVWPYRRALYPKSRYGSPEAPHEVLRRGELVWLNGALLQQVTALEDLRPGRFFIATDNAAGKITTGPLFVHPPKGVDFGAAIIEVAVRDRALRLNDRDNTVLRGLVFQNTLETTESDWPNGLSIHRSSNVLVEDCEARQNNGNGIGISGSRSAPFTEAITLRRVKSNGNGGNGIFANYLKNLLCEDTETSRNSFRGRWANHVEGFGSGGFKVMLIHGTTWRRHRSIDNFSTGMWWDADNTHITAEDCVMSGNYIRGMFVEYGAGPVLVKRCIITRTKAARTYEDRYERPAALSVSTTPNVTLESNIVWDNDVPQFGMWDLVRRFTKNFETGKVDESRPENHLYFHNVWGAVGYGQTIWNNPTKIKEKSGDVSTDYYFGSLRSRDNLFFHPLREHVFGDYRRDFYDGERYSLAEWRALIGKMTPQSQETGAIESDPGFVDASKGDFRLKPGSPLASWNLPHGLTAP